MSWVAFIWGMITSACLTLAAIHLLVWWRQREARAEAVFAVMALGTASSAVLEFWMMHAQTPMESGVALRWIHVPGLVVVVSLVGFVRLHLRAGRPWLAWGTCSLRTVSLILNFAFTPNLNFREITALRHTRFLGESISIAVGPPNPWMLVGQVSFLLLLAFVADAALTVWRRRDGRLALWVSVAIVFFVAAGSIQLVLALWGIVDFPPTVSPFFLGMLIAMGIALADKVLGAAQLAADLRETKAQMSLATEAADIGIWTWNAALNQVWGSDRWLDLFGFLRGQTVTMESVLHRIHPDDRETVENKFRQALAGRGDYEVDYRVVAPDGRQRWIAARGRLVPDVQGKPARMLGASIDITGRKRAELENAQQRNELAHLARVTTVSELSGSLAHELNQPLGIILSNAQAALRFLAQTPPDLAEVHDILADIISEDRRAGEVIQRLRSLLKRGESDFQLLTLGDVVDEVILLARSDLLGHGVNVRQIVASNEPQVRGDRIQLQQVVLNLVLNACDAMAGNPPVHRCLTFTTSHCAGAVRLSVADTGSGLPPDPERVFEPFYTTKSHGLGLGLGICRSIVSAHQGRLWAEANGVAAVEPPPGPRFAGATFHLELPAVVPLKTP